MVQRWVQIRNGEFSIPGASSHMVFLVAVLGNHDYRGDVKAQLDPILRRIDRRWFCLRSFVLNAGGLVTFIFLFFSLREKKWLSVIYSLSFRIFFLFFAAEIADFFFVDTTPFVDAYFNEPEDHIYDWRGIYPRETYVSNLLKVTTHPLDNTWTSMIHRK